MRLLLARPDPGNERFGLGPFFRVEPLGLEYLAAALAARGHECAIADLRFRPSLRSWLRRLRPRVVGISCMHALEYDEVVSAARHVRQMLPGAFVLAGGHAAAAFPGPLCDASIDAICLCDGESVVPELVEAVETGRPIEHVAGLLVPSADGWHPTGLPESQPNLDRVPLPDRRPVERYRTRYHCVNYRPVWLVETARGCPYRCSFCSVWQLYGRTFRERSVGAVVEDLAAVGPHVFLADDLFWHDAGRSLELARALGRRGIHKRWILAQTRTDLVARGADLLAAWRPLADRFDLFLGLEAASDRDLADLNKDAEVGSTLGAIAVARALGFGITGNFLIDHDFGEEDFQRLWDFVAAHRLRRLGFTIRTPLPGTEYFEQVRERVAGQPWFKYDMHHLLWQPRLGARRFFELYAETWRRSVLNLRGEKKLAQWAREVRARDLPFLARVLLRTQRLMEPDAYAAHHRWPLGCPAPCGLQPQAARRDGGHHVLRAGVDRTTDRVGDGGPEPARLEVAGSGLQARGVER